MSPSRSERTTPLRAAPELAAVDGADWPQKAALEIDKTANSPERLIQIHFDLSIDRYRFLI
jgi:hypothetical protein